MIYYYSITAKQLKMDTDMFQEKNDYAKISK